QVADERDAVAHGRLVVRREAAAVGRGEWQVHAGQHAGSAYRNVRSLPLGTRAILVAVELAVEQRERPAQPELVGEGDRPGELEAPGRRFCRVSGEEAEHRRIRVDGHRGRDLEVLVARLENGQLEGAPAV